MPPPTPPIAGDAGPRVTFYVVVTSRGETVWFGPDSDPGESALAAANYMEHEDDDDARLFEVQARVTVTAVMEA